MKKYINYLEDNATPWMERTLFVLQIVGATLLLIVGLFIYGVIMYLFFQYLFGIYIILGLIASFLAVVIVIFAYEIIKLTMKYMKKNKLRSR